jgi:hypothetical protein
MEVVDAIATLPTSTQGAYSETFEQLTLSDVPKSANNNFFVNRVCRNNDKDGVCSETEDLAPGGDGDGDGTADREQENVVSILTSVGGSATFSASAGMNFEIAGAVNSNSALSWLKTSFTSPPGQSVKFNNGMFIFLMTGTMNTAGETVTLYDRASTRPNRYYAYGKTPDDPTNHWYDFSYDGETGAEIMNDRIVLHFVDGKRGDEDLDPTNNSITHTGGQAVLTPIAPAEAQSGGCSITAKSSQAWRAGDWALVSVFLVVLAIIRKRARRG